MTEKIFLEDLEVGTVWESATTTLAADQIIAFARRFDPQPFHVDPELAESSHFGGLVASGWHTGSIAIRLLVDTCLRGVMSLGSPGFNDLRWLLPVRPGDALRVRATLTAKRRSRTKPDRGSFNLFVEVINQAQQRVMTLDSIGLIQARGARRDAGAPPGGRAS